MRAIAGVARSYGRTQRGEMAFVGADSVRDFRHGADRGQSPLLHVCLAPQRNTRP